jgi:hypothetical protein
MSRERALASITVSIRRLAEFERMCAAVAGLRERLMRLRQFQSARLEAAYRDLAGDARCAAAVEFFLTDLYGPLDYEARDREFQRASRLLGRMLPLGALESLALALELQVLTLDLDIRVAESIAGETSLSTAEYARAYRACGDRPARERQIELIAAIGRSLGRVVRQPSVEVLLRMAHLPAMLAGFGTLQAFIERGFGAFERVGDADAFMATIERRERAFMHALFTEADRTRSTSTAVAATAGTA